MAHVSGPATRTRSTKTSSISVAPGTKRVSISSSSVPLRASLSRVSSANLSTNNRRSITSRTVTAGTVSVSIPNQLADIASRLSALEKANSELQGEVIELKAIVSSQRDIINNFELISSAEEKGISVEQEKINQNIIIRGVDLPEVPNEQFLIDTFNNIRSHIGIEGEEDIAPSGAEILEPRNKLTGKTNSIVIRLKSISAKRSFLLARRSKFDIRPSDIKISQRSNSPLIITEQLTDKNQRLLFDARSLRGPSGFKYVWSSNGQILLRLRNKSRVIRVLDHNQIELLRIKHNIAPPCDESNLRTRTIELTPSCPQI